MKLDELQNRVRKGSQKKYRHPFATDDPAKYVGKWEKYDKPQGIKTEQTDDPFGAVSTTGFTLPYGYKADPISINTSAKCPGMAGNDEKKIRNSRKAPTKQAQRNVRKMSGNGRITETTVYDMSERDQQAILRTVLNQIEHKAQRERSYASKAAELLRDGNEKWHERAIDEWEKAGAPLPEVDGMNHHPQQEALNRFIREFLGLKPIQSESIHCSPIRFLTADYEVRDGQALVGAASVNEGVIELFAANDDANEAFSGQIFSKLLRSIVVDADNIGSNLSIELIIERGDELQHFFERFGFRRVAGNIFKRNTGSARPTSVML